MIIVSALSLSLRDKEREREKRDIELDNLTRDNFEHFEEIGLYSVVFFLDTLFLYLIAKTFFLQCTLY